MNNFRKITLGLLGATILSLGLYACSSDNEVTTNTSEPLEQGESLKGRSLDIEGIDEFVEKHIHLTLELGILLEESDINIDDKFEERLNNAETEEEVKNLLTNYGFKNANLMIQIKEKMNINSKNLLIKNPFLYDFPFEEVKVLLSEKVNSDFELYVPNPESEYPIEVKRTCDQQHKVDMYRCQRTHAAGLVTSAVIGLFTGGGGAVTGYALSSLAYYFCEQDAIEDLIDCRKG